MQKLAIASNVISIVLHVSLIVERTALKKKKKKWNYAHQYKKYTQLR